MKILLANPNTSRFITDRMVRAAQASVGEAAAILGVTAAHGPAVVGSRVENTLAASAALELGAAHADGCDAMILGISTDAGLEPLRELLDIPVVGMLEAALLTACQLGGRIGLLTLGERMLPLYQEQARRLGLGGRMAGWAGIELAAAFTPPSGDGAVPAVADAVVEHAARLVRAERLDVLVLSGAVLAGYRPAIEPRLPVPVIDGIEAAAWQAVALGAQKPAAHRAGSYVPPAGRRVSGVAAPLAERLASAPPPASAEARTPDARGEMKPE